MIGNNLAGGAWEEFRNIMKDAHETMPHSLVILRKYQKEPDRYKEDLPGEYMDIELQVLRNDNYMRTWPITMMTEAGGLDKQSTQLLFNKDYLRSLDLLTTSGNLDYDPGFDRFVLDGIERIPMGDTPAAQVQGTDIFFTVILKNEENSTGDFQIR